METSKEYCSQHPLQTTGNVLWIGGAGNCLCRTECVLPGWVKSAKIWIGADPHSFARDYWQHLRKDNDDGSWLVGGSFLKYRLYVNGELMGVGPMRALENGSPVVHCFDCHLRKGQNVIGVFSRGEKKEPLAKLSGETLINEFNASLPETAPWELKGN